MRKGTSVPPPKSYVFPFYAIRRITAPEDISLKRNVHSGCAPGTSFLELNDDENVREYLLDAEGKKRRRPTQVHRAIRETLDNNPENFCILNGGITIVARAVEIDDAKKVATLNGASIINGSQTQGQLREYYDRKKDLGESPFPLHVNFQIVETDDLALIADISISRNFQNDVMTLSIAGRLGQLDELEKAFQRDLGTGKLQKSETKLSEDYVKTEKLLQVITALTPAALWPKPDERDNPNKVYTYSMKAKCLKDYQVIYQTAKDPEAPGHLEALALYKFYLDICGEAWHLYHHWKQHQGFIGTYLHSIKREDGKVTEVPDGMVFPILAALSAFAVERDGRWTIDPPTSFSEKELINTAKRVYQEIALRNPWNMGKSKACYSSLYQISSIYRRLADAQ